MKYPVEVNAKWLVSVEAESALEAEHKILDNIKNAWGALAYDQAATRTDTFLGAIQGCEMISLDELYKKDMILSQYGKSADEAAEAVNVVKKELERMRARLANGEAELKELENKYGTLKETYDNRVKDFCGDRKP